MRIKVLHRGAYVGASDFEYRPGYVFVYDPSSSDYDWLVVYDEMPARDVGTVRKGREELKCPRERTILATTEPTSIKSYSRTYTRQFGHFLTNRPPEAEKHPHYHLGRGYYWWYLGRSYKECAQLQIPDKEKTISVVSSSKKMRHTKHAARYKLSEQLAREIPEMDWIGHGVRSFENKYDVLEPYKYHITLENHIEEHHWSEKLADALLAECLPFYAGDPAIAEIFPKESFIPIPIDDPSAAVEIVKSAIANGEYEKRRAAILEAKRLILEKYNFWAQVIELVESEGGQKIEVSSKGKAEFVFEKKALRRCSIRAAIEDGYLHAKEYVKRVLCL